MKSTRTTGTEIVEKPMRVGVFDTIAEADAAVADLLKVGFTKDQITVICSDKRKEGHFEEYEHQKPGGSRTPIAAATGSAIGAVLGGLTTIVGIVTTGGVGILAAGGIFASAGAIVGGFIGAMTTRGVDKELANYYDQAVERGKILVAAEDHSERGDAHLAEAEQILAGAGGKPIKLSEG
jgi:uncharacterized protein YcfJ